MVKVYYMIVDTHILSKKEQLWQVIKSGQMLSYSLFVII